jgi:hypothetical protein
MVDAGAWRVGASDATALGGGVQGAANGSKMNTLNKKKKMVDMLKIFSYRYE